MRRRPWALWWSWSTTISASKSNRFPRAAPPPAGSSFFPISHKGSRLAARGWSASSNGWSKFEPPIFFSLAREKKTGRSRSKRKERFSSAQLEKRSCFFNTRSPNRLASASNPAAAAWVLVGAGLCARPFHSTAIVAKNAERNHSISTASSSGSGKRSRSNQ